MRFSRALFLMSLLCCISAVASENGLTLRCHSMNKEGALLKHGFLLELYYNSCPSAFVVVEEGVLVRIACKRDAFASNAEKLAFRCFDLPGKSEFVDIFINKNTLDATAQYSAVGGVYALKCVSITFLEAPPPAGLI